MPHITPTRRSFEQGFRLVKRTTFMLGLVEVAPFLGATSMTKEQIEQAHADVLADMQARVAQYPGAYVIYDPNADAEGWMLVGDDPAALYAETEQMLADMED